LPSLERTPDCEYWIHSLILGGCEDNGDEEQWGLRT
jgi:hypothetical protein